MRIIRAESMGLCFGVRDALDYAEKLPQPESVTIYGELVHNDVINARLVRRGFHRLTEHFRDTVAPATPAVLITAHGISNVERARLQAAGHRLLDTTCPLVERAHQAALALDAEGYFVLVVGRRGHVEVRGLTGDLRAMEVVESAAEVRAYEAERIGVICQTTTPESLAREVLAAVRQLNPGKSVRFVDTICRPTRDRQEALDRLLPQVDALVVVGGRNSRNTRELAETARARGIPAYHVSGPAELDAGWFRGCSAVGLSAGTSTLDETIAAVHAALLNIAANSASLSATKVEERNPRRQPLDKELSPLRAS